MARENSLRGRVILRWEEAGKPDWDIAKTLNICIEVDRELEEEGFDKASRFREELKANNRQYLIQWVFGCRYPWLSKDKDLIKVTEDQLNNEEKTMSFTWIPFFEEMLNEICTKYDKDSLSRVFHEVFKDAGGRIDHFKDGTEGYAKEIDPLTFIAYFNRKNTDEKRIGYCSAAKNILKLTSSVPIDFNGTPSIHPQQTWFLTWTKDRTPEHMENLWEFSRQLNTGKINPNLFVDVLQMPYIGLAKLTIIMFVCKPHQFISFDKKNTTYFNNKSFRRGENLTNLISSSSQPFNTYMSLVDELRKFFAPKEFFEVSHEAHLAFINAEDSKQSYTISDEQFAFLKKRFDSRIPGFIDFQNPGESFKQNELDYKRTALLRYQNEVGNKQLRQLVEDGQGHNALIEISKRIGTNLVQYNSWRLSIGDDDKKATAILKAFLDVAEGTYEGSKSLKPIFDATQQQDLQASWDTFSTLLWAMNPESFAPVKIRYWRSLAEELGQELPSGRVTAEKYDDVLGWMKGFWENLESHGYKPNDWIDVHSFIWCVCPETYADRKEEVGEIPYGSRYWVIAPGENARLWDDFKENGIIAIGCDYLGDLAKYKDKNEIAETIQKIKQTTSSVKNDALGCFEFCKVMNIGDYVFAKKGRSEIIGYGQVVSDYKFDDSRAEYKNIRQVKWLKVGNWSLSGELGPITTKMLTNFTPYKDWISMLLKRIEGEIPMTESINYWWLNANPNIWNFSSLKIGEKQTYTTKNEKGNKRRIYKHFTAVQPGDIVVGYVASPDKEITAICKITKGIHLVGERESIEFEKTENIAIPVSLDELKTIPDLSNCEPLINNQGSLFKLAREEYEIIRDIIDDKNAGEIAVEIKPYSIEKALDGLFFNREEFEEILEVLRLKKNIILQGPPGVGKTYIARRLAFALMEQEAPQRIQMIQFHQSFSYEDFIQGYRPNDMKNFTLKNGIFYDFCKKAQRDSDNDYVFIIDEINRGNLSKIFGELTMLIEPDKRGNVYAVPLTYAMAADEKFYIPENLYLIGTMNTADRSLALVDYALRRRFSFITLSPKFDSPQFKKYLKSWKISDDLISKIIGKMSFLNEKIAKDEKNLGVGYQIGHSFFCPNDTITNHDLKWYERIIKHEIRPLLEEYWFDDLESVNKCVKELLD